MKCRKHSEFGNMMGNVCTAFFTAHFFTNRVRQFKSVSSAHISSHVFNMYQYDLLQTIIKKNVSRNTTLGFV